MKKFLSALLAMMMSISLLNAFAAEEAATEQTEEKVIVYSEDIKILNSFGIFSEDFFADPEKKVTRGELAYILDMMAGMGIEYNTTHYADVLSDHKYFSSIEAAYQLKTMQGYLDGKFRPDENITFEMAYKTMVCLTGHSFMAEKSSYPAVAASLKINEGINAKDTEEVNFEQIAKIIRNTFEVVGYKMYLSGNEISYAEDSSGKTFLENALDIYKEKGTIEATYVSSINSNIDTPRANSFKVNGNTYDQMDLDLELMLGYQVEFYYKYDEDSEERSVLYMFDENKYNNIEIVPVEDIQAVSNRTIKYYSQNRNKQFTVSKPSDIIVNGKVQDIYSDDLFNIEGGEIRFVKNYATGNEFVAVKRVTELVVNSVGTTQITVKGGGKDIEIGDFNPELKTEVYKNGKKFDISKVVANDVLEIVTDAIDAQGTVNFSEASFISGTVTAIKNQGTVTTINDENVTISGEVYKLSNTLEKYINNQTADALQLSVEYEFYLNSKNEIAFFKKKTASNEKVGIVMKARTYTEAGDDETYIDIFESDGKLVRYYIRDEIKIDGVNKQKGSVFVNNFNSLAESLYDPDTATYFDVVMPHNRLVYYRINETVVKNGEEEVTERELIEIDTLAPNPQNYEGEQMTGECVIEIGAKSHRYINSMMGNKFRFSNTAMYYIPRIDTTSNGVKTWNGIDYEDEDNYGAGSSAYNKAGLSSWFNGVYAYMMSEDFVPRASAAYPRKSNTGKVNIDGSASSGRVIGFGSQWDEEEQAAVDTIVLSGGDVIALSPEEENVLQCVKDPWKDSEETVPNLVQEGDIIRYWNDVNGYVIGIDIAISADDIRAGMPKINKDSSLSNVPYQEQYITRWLYGLAYRAGASTISVAKNATKDEITGEITYNLENSSSNFEVFSSSVTYYLVEKGPNGKWEKTKTTSGEIRTYEDYGNDADMVVVCSGYKGATSVTIYRDHENYCK